MSRHGIVYFMVAALAVGWTLLPESVARGDGTADFQKKIEALEKALQQKEELLKKTQEENAKLQDLLAKREKQILVIEQLKEKLAKEFQQATNENKVLATRLDQLEKMLRELTKKVAELEAAPPGAVKPPKNKGNPPPVKVNGLIEKVSAANNVTLARINLGSDAGLQVGHTLEVFRKTPAPKYLGMIRIVEVTATSAVGQLVPSPGGAAVELKAGDQVTSQILPGD